MGLTDKIVSEFLYDEPTTNKFRFVQKDDDKNKIYLPKSKTDGKPPAMLRQTIEEIT